MLPFHELKPRMKPTCRFAGFPVSLQHIVLSTGAIEAAVHVLAEVITDREVGSTLVHICR